MAPTPALGHLLGAYYNQDWADFYASDEQTIDEFVADSPDRIRPLVSEIAWVLAEFPDESDLDAYLLSQGCEYIPQGPGGYRAWLQQIADRVRAATA
ncbi:contact-dependent growth inhibition system immunity protein [Nocardioides sp.]|uniref:contact-dependent growth inhibition system immunity protein n=1 Tax=Nocardioides sp. TaxID=35761 RepID=UPI00378410B8